MLIFNCTKAAAEFFSKMRKGVKTGPIQPTPDEPLIGRVGCLDSAWLVHVVRVYRKPTVIAMHIETRYCMFFNGVRKGDSDAFINMLLERLINNMQRLGEAVSVMDDSTLNPMADTFLQSHRECHFYLRGDRRTQGNLNEAVWMYKYHLMEMGDIPQGGEHAAMLDTLLNHQLRKAYLGKDYIFPDEEMVVRWLGDYCRVSETMQSQVRQRFRYLRREAYDEQVMH